MYNGKAIGDARCRIGGRMCEGSRIGQRQRAKRASDPRRAAGSARIAIAHRIGTSDMCAVKKKRVNPYVCYVPLLRRDTDTRRAPAAARRSRRHILATQLTGSVRFGYQVAI
jgi:hypothetical protein